MSIQETFEELALEQWVDTAQQHRTAGYRLVQMTGTARSDHFEIMVSYDKDYRCVNYRLYLPSEQAELPSLRAVFPAAFTYENELKDLFGITVSGLSVDYGGHFLRTKTKIPFTGEVVVKKAAGEKAAASPSTTTPPTAGAPQDH